MKRCPRCRTSKPFSDFWKSRNCKDGLYGYCKDCSYSYVYRDASPEKKAKYRQYVRNRYLKITYGITLIEYEALFTKQGRCCAICKRPDDNNGKSLAVDHNKETGKIRGILCENCNRGIGLLKHDVSLFESAIIYLSKRTDLV